MTDREKNSLKCWSGFKRFPPHVRMSNCVPSHQKFSTIAQENSGHPLIPWPLPALEDKGQPCRGLLELTGPLASRVGSLYHSFCTQDTRAFTRQATRRPSRISYTDVEYSGEQFCRCTIGNCLSLKQQVYFPSCYGFILLWKCALNAKVSHYTINTLC